MWLLQPLKWYGAGPKSVVRLLNQVIRQWRREHIAGVVEEAISISKKYRIPNNLPLHNGKFSHTMHPGMHVRSRVLQCAFKIDMSAAQKRLEVTPRNALHPSCASLLFSAHLHFFCDQLDNLPSPTAPRPRPPPHTLQFWGVFGRMRSTCFFSQAIRSYWTT